MIRVGITGGIGTGKTFICNIFRFLGIPVYDADLRAKQLVEESLPVKQEIIKLFGSDAFNDQGQYNRKLISSKIFQQPELKLALEHIIHPAVRMDSQNWFKYYEDHHLAYVLKEAALLYESGSHLDLDQVIVVDAPVELRIQRLIQREGWNEDEIKLRMSNQWSQEEKLRRADFIILNDGKSPVIPQVWSIHHQLLKHSALSL